MDLKDTVSCHRVSHRTRTVEVEKRNQQRLLQLITATVLNSSDPSQQSQI